jgi:hypothetical protein
MTIIRKLRKSAVIFLSFLFNVQFICVVHTANAFNGDSAQYKPVHHAYSCCDSQKSGCHLEELSLSNNNTNDPDGTDSADCDNYTSLFYRDCEDVQVRTHTTDFPSFNCSLREIQTVRLLL